MPIRTEDFAKFGRVRLAQSRLRLAQLSAYLAQLPPGRFSNDVIVSRSWSGRLPLGEGVRADALGHAATMPEFQVLGLRLVKSGGVGRLVLNSPDQPERPDFDPVLSHRPRGPLSIAAELFHLTLGQANFCFYPNRKLNGCWSPLRNATSKQVAAHLYEFALNYRTSNRGSEGTAPRNLDSDETRPW